jgi:hypothetical protein
LKFHWKRNKKKLALKLFMTYKFPVVAGTKRHVNDSNSHETHPMRRMETHSNIRPPLLGDGEVYKVVEGFFV